MNIRPSGTRIFTPLQKTQYVFEIELWQFQAARTDKNLNSRAAKDSQGLVRTCQVLDQSLHVPRLALQVLDQSLEVLGNPGDTLPRTGTRKNPKPIQGL